MQNSINTIILALLALKGAHVSDASLMLSHPHPEHQALCLPTLQMAHSRSEAPRAKRITPLCLLAHTGHSVLGVLKETEDCPRKHSQ